MLRNLRQVIKNDVMKYQKSKNITRGIVMENETLMETTAAMDIATLQDGHEVLANLASETVALRVSAARWLGKQQQNHVAAGAAIGRMALGDSLRAETDPATGRVMAQILGTLHCEPRLANALYDVIVNEQRADEVRIQAAKSLAYFDYPTTLTLIDDALRTVHTKHKWTRHALMDSRTTLLESQEARRRSTKKREPVLVHHSIGFISRRAVPQGPNLTYATLGHGNPGTGKLGRQLNL